MGVGTGEGGEVGTVVGAGGTMMVLDAEVVVDVELDVVGELTCRLLLVHRVRPSSREATVLKKVGRERQSKVVKEIFMSL